MSKTTNTNLQHLSKPSPFGPRKDWFVGGATRPSPSIQFHSRGRMSLGDLFSESVGRPTDFRQHFRQGDVLIIKKSTGEEIGATFSFEPREDGRLILAHGEATGHAHAVLDERAFLHATPDKRRRFLRVVEAPVDLVHEEHAPISIPVGDWEVVRQREWDHTAEGESRWVLD